jgi:16S rRNA (cytosine967-C5)-methyltransferase
MKFDNLLRYAVRILAGYSGEITLQAWLKNFFRENPQMGSHDRKQVSEMLYCFFRLGHSLKKISAEERILTGLFLCNHKKEPLLEQLRPEWHAETEMSVEEKLKIVCLAFPEFNPLEIFPWKSLLSAGIDHRAFCMSFLGKPKIFIRVRPGNEKTVEQKLRDHSVHFQNADPDDILSFKTFAFTGATKLDDLVLLNREAVLQDLSSQRTAIFLKKAGEQASEVWDCCAGSGGKSILLADLYPGCLLTVSDIRESILKNLSVRLNEAGVRPRHILKADLTDRNSLPRESFPFILADLPCTGSGTWSRTPEALYFFKPESISDYRRRQEKILSNISGHLRPGGVLVYITCSVFAEENEKVSALLSDGGLRIEDQGIIAGYGQAADSMYAARFIKAG